MKTSRCRARPGILPRSPTRSFRQAESIRSRKSSVAPKSCLLGANINDSLFPGGDAVGQSIVMDGAVYRVLGVFEKRKGGFFGENRQDNVVMIPLKTIQMRYPDAETVVLVLPGKSGTARHCAL